MLQNRFQSLVVVAVSFLLVSQFRNQHPAMAAPAPASVSAPSASPPRAALPPLDSQDAKRRLQILLADPSLQLQHLVTELAALAGLPQMGLLPEAELQVSLFIQLEQQLLTGQAIDQFRLGFSNILLQIVPPTLSS